MSPYNVGIIGYGGFGRFLHQAWSKLPEVRIIAASKRRLAPENVPGLKIYPDWHDLIADPEVQIVAITTPPHLHATLACTALEAGKQLLIEKPLALNVADARRIIATQQKTGQIAAINYILRFNPLIQALEGLSQANLLGPLRRVVVENYAGDQGLPPEHWFWNPQFSGGIAIEHAVHFIDLVNHLTDQHQLQADGAANQRVTGQEDQVLINVLYDGGLMATHYHYFARPAFFETTTIRLAYEHAQIDLQGWIPLTGQITAWIDNEALARLSLLPGFRLLQNMPVPDPVHPQLITATFGLSGTKQEVYAECARSSLVDLLTKIKNPEHQLRATLEDGLISLAIAAEATANFTRLKSRPAPHTSAEQQ